MYMYTRTRRTYTRTHVHMSTHLRTHTRIHTPICIHTRVCVHTTRSETQYRDSNFSINRNMLKVNIASLRLDSERSPKGTHVSFTLPQVTEVNLVRLTRNKVEILHVHTL